MKLKLNLSIVLLVLLSSCSTLTDARKTIANASEEVKQGQTLPITAMAKIGGETIQLEVASSPEQQGIGLMFRESLGDNRGMLFPFGMERNARFWMKNVPISLDMIFLNGDRIVGIAADVPPCTTEPCPIYGPEALVDNVIELRGGRAEELGIEINNKILIKHLDSLQQQNN
ncbi:DUF192 domain-containing protein [Waterburya agarophytonicola K14]|uniref:DUF192 domain-containing protein n=1 Tax=Waterburya agarophytonicola KI4 TaxID=2874699 RepID=A0A964FGM5_9CYAN|nr:DUF192 domain-containing protein [Waterburya agarophytonicola]MCC0179095.1 DUF192 domain-containing protein [Waterburya agarophytonicola KI4]